MCDIVGYAGGGNALDVVTVGVGRGGTSTMEPVREPARSLRDHSTVLFLGRHVGCPVALEGTLKIKELACMHAEGFAAGELKHGPIALVEPGLPVVPLQVFACEPATARGHEADQPRSLAKSVTVE